MSLNDKLGIFIFRKDLRIEDNRGLIKLSKLCKEILPIFIFDPFQVDLTTDTKNYLSFPALKFITESVIDLNIILSSKKFNSDLNVFYGKPDKVLQYIIKNINLKKNSEIEIIVGFNEDYTKYSLERDAQIIKYCKSMNIECVTNSDDNLLCDFELLLKEPNIPYKQYGAFKKNMLKHSKKFNSAEKCNIKFIKKNKYDFNKKLTVDEINEFWIEHIDTNYKPSQIGSRANALNKLANLNKFKDYALKRDILSYETTHLSAYLNFGLISEREFYWTVLNKLGKSSQLINQIIWREYYLCLLKYLNKANDYSEHIDPRYNKLKWFNIQNNDIGKYKNSIEWIEWNLMMKSKTGFLIIDAAIQELINTGFMHNRCRMIVGVFSVKYLKINPLCRFIGLNDWFSRYLLDCSTSQNKLNSQWVTELDFPGKKFSPSNAPIAGRPMSISNDMIKKWDPDCIYIKKWLPHLATIDNKILYKWDTKYIENLHPKPIFDSKQRYKEWIDLCKN
jgi:deoxyribodipyrimidine photo-lyase